MILIWSGDGGPLQYLGLLCFILQFFAPQLVQLAVDVQYASRGGNFNDTVSSSHVWSVALVVLWFAVAIAGWFFFVVWDLFPFGGGGAQQPEQQQEEEEGQRDNGGGVENENGNLGNNGEAAVGNEAEAEAAPSGTAANPVVIDDDDDDNNNNNNNNNDNDDNMNNNNDDDDWITIGRIPESLQPSHLVLAAGLLLPLAVAAPMLSDLLRSHSEGGMWRMMADTGVLQITAFAIVAHSIMAVAAYRVLRDVLDSGGSIGPYPGNRGRGRRSRKLTVGEIADVVRRVPVEEYVSPEEVGSGECSVSRLKRMLVNRGASEAAERCLVREDLVKEINMVRKFNEECAICAEEYKEGDVLRVPHCQHEFHLHCFDKWIYTFSTDSRPAMDPTCPLCKALIR